MTSPERSKAILSAYKTESAWDLMTEFMHMSELERGLLSVQLHLVDAMNSSTTLECRIELEHAWHELDQVMQNLSEERKSGI